MDQVSGMVAMVKEGRDADLRIVPVDLADSGEHKTSDQNECRCRGEVGNGPDDGSDEDGEEEEYAG